MRQKSMRRRTNSHEKVEHVRPCIFHRFPGCFSNTSLDLYGPLAASFSKDATQTFWCLVGGRSVGRFNRHENLIVTEEQVRTGTHPTPCSSEPPFSSHLARHASRRQRQRLSYGWLPHLLHLRVVQRQRRRLETRRLLKVIWNKRTR